MYIIHNQYITSLFVKKFGMSALNEIIAIDNISESLVNVGLFVFSRYIYKSQAISELGSLIAV